MPAGVEPLVHTPFSSLLSRIVLNAEAKLPVAYVLVHVRVHGDLWSSPKRKGFGEVHARHL